MSVINFADDVSIDENRLDQEWLTQTMLFMRYAEEASKAKQIYDISKEELDVLMAKADCEIREKHIKENLKITEDKIKNLVILNTDVQAKKLEVIDKLYELNVYNNLTKAFEQRKSALEQLVKLFLQGYYASPTAPKSTDNNTKESSMEAQKQYARKYELD